MLISGNVSDFAVGVSAEINALIYEGENVYPAGRVEY